MFQPPTVLFDMDRDDHQPKRSLESKQSDIKANDFFDPQQMFDYSFKHERRLGNLSRRRFAEANQTWKAVRNELERKFFGKSNAKNAKRSTSVELEAYRMNGEGKYVEYVLDTDMIRPREHLVLKKTEVHGVLQKSMQYGMYPHKLSSSHHRLTPYQHERIDHTTRNQLVATPSFEVNRKKCFLGCEDCSTFDQW